MESSSSFEVDPGSPQLTPDQARAALSELERAQLAAKRAGLYSRTVAGVVAVWSGLTAAALAWGHPVWWLLLFGGVAALEWRRRRAPATLREVSSRREFAWTWALGLVFGAIFIAGPVLTERLDSNAVPVVTGVLVAAGLFALMEVSHRGIRARLASEGAP